MTKHTVMRKILVVACCVLAACSLIGGISLALSKDSANQLTNTFTPVKPDTKVVETFSDNVKKNVTAKNTGDAAAYVRIQLVSYRVDESGNHIGGTAAIPTFTPGEGWLRVGTTDVYVYSKAVAPNASASDLIGDTGITLAAYTDLDGGYQVVEVLSEAIQAQPADAVEEAWGVTVGVDGTLSLS